MLHRRLVIENRSTVPVDVMECIDYDAGGKNYVGRIRLEPSGCKTIRAARYCNRSMNSPRLSFIEFVVDGVVKEWLSPVNFVQFVKMTVDVDAKGVMTITGVVPKPFDICWLWGFGFLGRQYAGRLEVAIGNMMPVPENTSNNTSSPEHVWLEAVHR